MRPAQNDPHNSNDAGAVRASAQCLATSAGLTTSIASLYLTPHSLTPCLFICTAPRYLLPLSASNSAHCALTAASLCASTRVSCVLTRVACISTRVALRHRPRLFASLCVTACVKGRAASPCVIFTVPPSSYSSRRRCSAGCGARIGLHSLLPSPSMLAPPPPDMFARRRRVRVCMRGRNNVHTLDGHSRVRVPHAISQRRPALKCRHRRR